MNFDNLYSGLQQSNFTRSETAASNGVRQRQGFLFNEYPNKHDVEDSVLLVGPFTLPDVLDDTSDLLLSYGFDLSNVDVDNVELEISSEDVEVTGATILQILPDHSLQPSRKRARRFGTELGYLGEFKARLLWESPIPGEEKIIELRNWIQSINTSALRLHMKSENSMYGILKNGTMSLPVSYLAQFMEAHRCKLQLSFFGQKLTQRDHGFLSKLCSNIFEEDYEKLRIDYGIHALTQICRKRMDNNGFCMYIPFFKVAQPSDLVRCKLLLFFIITSRIRQPRYANFSNSMDLGTLILELRSYMLDLRHGFKHWSTNQQLSEMKKS
jgi:hypothetical protein